MVPRWWRPVLDVALVAWIVRAPLTTAVLGVLILWLAPQAQDLFADGIGGTSWRRLMPILGFSILLLLIWAIPLHYSARLLLDTDQQLARVRARYRLAPRAARRLGLLVRHLPRLIGFTAFVAVGIGLTRAKKNLPTSSNIDLLDQAHAQLRTWAIGTAITAVVYLAYVQWRSAGVFGRAGDRANAVADRLKARVSRTTTQASQGKAAGVTYLGLLFLFSLGIYVAGVSLTSETFSRSAAIPVILGAWLPILTLLSHYGRHYRVPFILGGFVLSGLLALTLGDNHDIRLVQSGPKDPASAAPAFELGTAVASWKAVNTCAGPDCPRPLIIAAAGGASRAGFMTASVIGDLIDQSSPMAKDATSIRNRIFAISGVSGGSVGAAFTVAAMKQAGRAGTPPCKGYVPGPEKPPTLPPGELWFGTQVGGWRDCLELMLAGDFLTSTALGLALFDFFPFMPWPDRGRLIERAFEQRFARAVQGSAPDAKKCFGLECPFNQLQKLSSDTWLPILVLNGTSVSSGHRVITTALQLDYLRTPGDVGPPCVRGAQDGTCRLFVDAYRFHDMVADASAPDSDQNILWRALAWLQRALLANYWLGERPDDVRVSTAAHNSARFPVISPPGAIRNRELQIIDRLVDGGYFENYGVTSALELFRALERYSLKPLLLVISNDPEVPTDMQEVVPGTRWERFRKIPKVSGVVHVDSRDAEAATEITGPITAFANTRGARGTLILDQLRAELGQAVVHVRTVPAFLGNAFQPLSMSWWMSKPVQSRLHEQIECDFNRRGLGVILAEYKLPSPEARNFPCLEPPPRT